MPILNVSQQGRFGNQCMIYLWARGMAEHYGYELRCDEWVGDRIFEEITPRYAGKELPRYNELTLQAALQRGEDCEFRGYGQMGIHGLVSPAGVRLISNLMPYSKKQAQRWMNIRQNLRIYLDAIPSQRMIVAHHRTGDFRGYSYPMVSLQSIEHACWSYALNQSALHVCTEENPTIHPAIPEDLSFLPDFYRMMRAPVLIRANSSFSFVAGLLSDGIVLSPRIDGLKGGVEHDGVHFEDGNHCRLSDHDFCSDLHVLP